MPIYEFYCEDCNTNFNFFSSRIDTKKRPLCPKCNKRTLERIVSRFSVLRGARETDDIKMPDLDEGTLQKAMSFLEQEAKNLNEDDPKQAAHLMRKLLDTTGMNPGPGMEEALRRIEAGADPDQIEKELGGSFNEEELFNMTRKTIQKERKRPPLQDETLYYL